MFDIFLQDDMSKLLKKKHIVFMGDSNIRALYKDFLCLLHKTQFISDQILRNKMEDTVFGDKLVFHGPKSNGRTYREEREATFKSTKVSFFFLTRVFDDYVKKVIKKITYKSDPDVIIINCCLWDITRWGYDGVEKYKENLNLLMKQLKKNVPDSLVIWITAPPIACEVKGGFLVKELQFLKYSLRFHVVEANHYARKIVVENGFDLLDSHYHLKMQIHRRTGDGIHWLPPAVRYVTNLLLTHISLAWNIPLPHRYQLAAYEENLLLTTEKNNVGPNDSKKKMTKITSEDSSATYSSEINTSNSVNKQASQPLCQKTKKKNETIHAHMSRIQKKKRLQRIRRWDQPNRGDSPTHDTLQSSCQPVSGNYYNSSSNSLKNEQMKSWEETFVNGSFPSSHCYVNPVISHNQNSLPYSLGPFDFRNNSYSSQGNFTFGNNMPYFQYANNYNMPCFNFANNCNQSLNFTSHNNAYFDLRNKENIYPVYNFSSCVPQTIDTNCMPGTSYDMQRSYAHPHGQNFHQTDFTSDDVSNYFN